MSETLNDFYPFLTEAYKRHPQLFTSEHHPRYLLRKRRQNGLDKYLNWIGRTPVTSDARLMAWLEEQKR